MLRDNERPLVVMVDDEKDFTDIVARWAEPGYRFAGFQSAEDLFRGLGAMDPDLIVLDLGLPGIGGFEACRRLRADHRLAEVPVLFLTGSREDEDFLTNMRAGGTAYLTKPVGRLQLLAAFEELLGGPVETVDTAAGD